MRITCIADLHGELPQLSGGDLLIIAGDITAAERVKEWENFFVWIANQAYKKVVLVGGNHDKYLTQCITTKELNELKELHGHIDYDYAIKLGPSTEYLCDTGFEFEGYKIWGAPWVPYIPQAHPAYNHFTKRSEDELRERWQLIPDDTDILVTHGPPWGIFDEINGGVHVGSTTLRERVIALSPKLHVFGHIHEHGGKVLNTGMSLFVNAAYMDADYVGTNTIVTVEI